ncbi:hypothetical protein B0H14DRAFT_2650321, partial [Mycena olivaceomarginata]
SGKLEDTTRKLTEIKHQLYDLRQLVLRIGTRLISWEKRESVATLEEEVAETRRFIGTVGGQLWDGARETVEAMAAAESTRGRSLTERGRIGNFVRSVTIRIDASFTAMSEKIFGSLQI